MRDAALSRLDDADLQFSPGGDNLTFGELLKKFGETQYSYLQSLRTLGHDWSYRNDTLGLSTSISGLRTWFKQLDNETKQVLKQLTQDDLKKQINRGNGVIRTVEEQLDIYIQALMIFFGKLVIYFKTMSKPLPESIEQYIT